MKILSNLLLVGTLFLLFSNFSVGQNDRDAIKEKDPFMWLEEIEGKKALEWVEAHNRATVDILKKYPGFSEMNQRILEIMNSKEKIAYPQIRGKYIYNFWQDDHYKRGVWRRTSLKEYLQGSPAWEIVIDLDVLSEKEGEKWAFKGAHFLYPDYTLCLVRLSRGGGDAVVIREFDLKKKTFVEDGFSLPQSKGGVSWIDKDTLIVQTNFGEGSMTTSGYPRITKIWKRGTPLSEAKVLFEGEKTDVSVGGYAIHTPERVYIVVNRGITFYTSHTYVVEKDELVKLDIPDDADFSGILKNQMFIRLKSDWNVAGKTYKQGSLLSIDYDNFLKKDRDFQILVTQEERTTLDQVASTENFLLVTKLTNICSELFQYSLQDGKWKCTKVETPDLGQISIRTTDEFSDQYFWTYTNFLSPNTLYYTPSGSDASKKVQSMPHFFDSSQLEVQQHEAISKDGTRIPYFLVLSTNCKLDGSNPTLLYGYGGFEISLTPSYNAVVGSSWIEKGGVYVLANLRGGGEFGPQWHQAGLKENRQRIYDDFVAVAEDLIHRKVTSPKHLGIMGGSNGGLLVGVAFTQRPDLYNAVICSVPLLDMQRYNKLLAGASWMGEFGNPDIPEEWAYIKKYSPYHNVVASQKYPKVFFMTTTRDDRVHPGHARKMAAKMEKLGHDFFYFENTEGGHGSGVTNKQRAFMDALRYTYLWKMLAD